MQLPFALLIINLVQDATNEDYLMNSVLLIGLIDLLLINSLIKSIDFWYYRFEQSVVQFDKYDSSIQSI